MKQILGKYKILLGITFISVFISSIAVIYQPDVIADIINAINATDAAGNANPDKAEIYRNGYILIILGILNLVFGIITAITASKVAQGVGADLREMQFRNIQSFSLNEIDKFKTSNLIVRMTNDVTQIQNFIMLGLSLIIRVPVIFFGSFFLAILNFPNMWWAIIVYVLLVGVVMFIAMRRMGPLFGQMQKDIDQVNTIVKENMDGVRVVKSFVTEKKEGERFNERVEMLTDKLEAVGATFSTIIPIFMLIANLLTALAIFLTASWALDDMSLIGGVYSFTMYLMQIMFALIMAGLLSMTMSRAIVSYKRIREVLDTKTSIIYGNETYDSINSIEFKNVDYRYMGDEENTLKDINFKITKGEKIGVVGLTGSGKTTLASLFVRLYDTTKGEILINDKPLKSYSEKVLRDTISLVLQKAVLFSGTIEDNIKQGKPDATMEEMIEAAKAAQSYEFIEKKEGKFKSEVLEKGNNFSGGQKQRLSITRGLVKKPELLILDDSTSALDARSEKLVKEAINKIDDNITILIAQKITSVIDLDRIIVLDEGRVDAIGTHDELIASSQTYRKIFESQRGKERK